MDKSKIIHLNTGKETGLAFLDEETLTDYCKSKCYKIAGSISWGTSLLNEKGAEIGYLTKPGHGITLKDPDYKWIIVWT